MTWENAHRKQSQCINTDASKSQAKARQDHNIYSSTALNWNATVENTQTQTEAQTQHKTDIHITFNTNTRVEAMQGLKQSMHTTSLKEFNPISRTHTHTFSVLLSFLPTHIHTHIDLTLNTNTVVQMTQAYFVNQKNPQEKYLTVMLLSLLWTCVVWNTWLWQETQTCSIETCIEVYGNYIKAIFCPWTLAI